MARRLVAIGLRQQDEGGTVAKPASVSGVGGTLYPHSCRSVGSVDHCGHTHLFYVDLFRRTPWIGRELTRGRVEEDAMRALAGWRSLGLSSSVDIP